MPQTITKLCQCCRTMIRFVRKQLKGDRREMYRRTGEKRSGTPTCSPCFNMCPLGENGRLAHRKVEG